jgi:hypothetical protein
MNVGSIAEEEHPTRAIVRNLAAVDPETREPNGIESL